MREWKNACDEVKDEDEDEEEEEEEEEKEWRRRKFEYYAGRLPYRFVGEMRSIGEYGMAGRNKRGTCRF